MMSITMQEDGARIYLAGNTYPIKEQIKTKGGHWDADRKMWWIGKGKRDVIAAVIADAPVLVPGKCSKCGESCREPYTLCLRCKPPFRHTRCKECGAAPNARGWPRIYKNGICSDCYQSEREEREMGY